MNIVRDYMLRTMVSILEDDSIYDAIKLMHKTEMSLLPVVDDENRLIGTIYSKKILGQTIPEQFGFLEHSRVMFEMNQAADALKTIKTEKVSKYMNAKTISVKDTDKMDNVADLMYENKETYLFVVNNENKLRGYISRADLLYYLLEVGEENES